MITFALMENSFFNAAEDTLFQVKKSLNCKGRLLDLSTPVVMGIVNMTPDSFHDGGLIKDDKSLLLKVETMLNEGAVIIDVGGQSTRPRSIRIDALTEWKRIEQPIKIIHSTFPEAIISVDTFYSDVARKAVEAGASMINDISAGGFDEKIYSVAAESGSPYIAMHMQGEPATMQDNPHYVDVVDEVLHYFVQKTERIKMAGVKDIILDPGFGFGKNQEHNFNLLNKLSVLRIFGLPILVGLSRKSMVTRLLNIKSENALNGTTVLNTIALLQGASILRVHDVKEAIETIKITEQLRQY